MGKRTFFLKILEDRRNNPHADRSQQGDVYCQRLGRSPSAATQECMPVHVPGCVPMMRLIRGRRMGIS